ncbi:MAG: DUF4430 domain-containing protein [Patescibacteria group bacterium]|nr:DUF4430 domain-containing protein [Patescibacteria group bacterium]
MFVFSSIILFWQAKDLRTIKLSPIEETEIGEVLYLINRGEGNISQYQIEITDNSTVFSLLEELAERENFEIEMSFYPEMGVFVESINGLKNGTAGKFWQYWVNGELPMIAADKKRVKAGDIIEWKFISPSF